MGYPNADNCGILRTPNRPYETTMELTSLTEHAKDIKGRSESLRRYL